jgi:hypothetical protein
MKKITILFIALTFALTSCSSDESAPTTLGNIVGVWKGVNVDYSGTTVTSAQGQTINSDYVGEAYNVDYSVTFTENPNNLTSSGSYSVKLTTTVTGQTNVSYVENLNVLGDGTWQINNNELSITTSIDTNKMKIEKLTESELILSGTYVADLSQSGVSVISTTNTVITFIKQ